MCVCARGGAYSEINAFIMMFTVYYAVCLCVSLTSFLPDPYAFCTTWKYLEYSTTRSFYKHYHVFLHARSFLTHLVSFSFVLFVSIVVGWPSVTNDSAITNQRASIILVGCVFVAFWATLFKEYTSGAAVSVAIALLIMRNFDFDEAAIFERATREGTAGLIALAAIAGYLLVHLCARAFLSRYQYCLTNGFTLAFAPAFLYNGMRHYSVGWTKTDTLWTPIVSAIVLAIVLAITQHCYRHNGCCQVQFGLQQHGHDHANRDDDAEAVELATAAKDSSESRSSVSSKKRRPRAEKGPMTKKARRSRSHERVEQVEEPEIESDDSSDSVVVDDTPDSGSDDAPSPRAPTVTPRTSTKSGHLVKVSNGKRKPRTKSSRGT